MEQMTIYTAQRKPLLSGQLIKCSSTPPPALPAPVPGSSDSSRDKEPSAIYCLGSLTGGGAEAGGSSGRGRKRPAGGRASPGLPSRSDAMAFLPGRGEYTPLARLHRTRVGWTAGYGNPARGPSQSHYQAGVPSSKEAEGPSGAADTSLTWPFKLSLNENEAHSPFLQMTSQLPCRHHRTMSCSVQRAGPPGSRVISFSQRLGHVPPKTLPSLPPMGQEGRWGKGSLRPGVQVSPAQRTRPAPCT